MQYVTVDAIPVPVSHVVLGTDWCDARRLLRIAGRPIALPGANRRRLAHVFDVFDAAVDAGFTAFDTARHYAGSEAALGEWLRRRGLRDRVVLITKGGHPGPGGEPRLSAADISADLEASRRQLGVDCVDLYLLHRDDEGTAEPILDALHAHVARGHIRQIGVSNWRQPRIEAAQAAAARRGQRGFAASSLQLSLASWVSPPWPGARSVSGAEGEAERAWYRTQPLWFLAYSSLGMGFFSTARAAVGAATTTATLAGRTFDSVENRERRARVQQLAAERGVSAGQVALAWVLHELPRALAVVGSRQPAAVVDAAGASGLSLSETERRWLVSGGARPGSANLP